MKKLLYLILLLPLWATAQTNGTIQKTSATGTIRGSFGSLGLDTLPRVTGALVDGYILKYHAATNKWYASPDPTLVGLQDSLTKKANRTFDNVASGAIAKSKVDTSATGLLPKSNLFPLGDTRYLKIGDAPTGISATSPITYNDTTGAIGINQSSASTNGYLSSSDWNTFNGKQAALSGTGLLKMTGTTPSYITDNSGNWNTAYGWGNPSGVYLPLAGGTLTGDLTGTRGIFSTSSTSPVTVNSTGAGVFMPFSISGSAIGYVGSGAALFSGGSNDYMAITGASGKGLQLGTNNFARMTMDVSGNTSWTGMASFGARVDVTSSAANGARVSVNQAYNAGASSFGYDFYRTYDTGGANQLAGFIRVARNGGNSNTGIEFGVANQGTTPTTQMTLSTSGNLSLTGNISGGGDATFTGNVTGANLTTFTRSDVGFVPSPGGSGTVRYLREDGSWVDPTAGGGGGTATDLSLGTRTNTTQVIGSSTGTGVTLPAVTTSLAGLMSGTDKTKLDGIASGATANTGTVESVAMTVPTGLTVSGSPITTSGTLAISLQSGYSIPTTANQTNWSTAYSQTRQWDGGSTGLSASTGRTSLGGTTVGQNLFTLANPSDERFIRINADNTVSATNANTFKFGLGLEEVDNTSDADKPISNATQSALNTKLSAVNLALGTRTGTTVPITNSAGTGFTLPVSTTSLAGVMSSADKTKLDGIASGATANTGTVTSISSGNGMNFTTITGSGPVTLGTPSSITSSSTNSVSTNSHTHAITSLPSATTATTQSPGDNSTKIATTAYVDGSLSSKTSRVLKDWYTDANNVSSSPTDLYDYTVPANTMLNNGDKLNFRISGIYASSSDVKTITVYFGLSNIALTPAPLSVVSEWIIEGTIIRNTSTTYRMDINNNIGTISVAESNIIGSVTNYTGTNVFKIVGTGGASADITAQMGYLEFKPAAL